MNEKNHLPYTLITVLASFWDRYVTVAILSHLASYLSSNGAISQRKTRSRANIHDTVPHYSPVAELLSEHFLSLI